MTPEKFGQPYYSAPSQIFNVVKFVKTGFSALPEFRAPFYGNGQIALNPWTTVFAFGLHNNQILSGGATRKEV